MKLVELDTSEDLSEKALAEAVKRVAEDMHDGWADLTVHQSQVRAATKIAAAHNATSRGMQIRVQCSTLLAHEDWTLKTRSVELRVQRT